MNELYAETAVKKQENAKSLFIKVLSILVIAFGVFLLFVGGLYSITGVLTIMIPAYMFTRLNIEYEYVFVDDQLDFDKIIGKSKRKHILRINFEQVEIMAPTNSNSLSSFNQMKLEVKDFSSGDSNAKSYTIIVNKESEKLKIIFEPNEKMIKCIKQKNSRKLVTY
ncbi:MAG TPA: hypothetical protein GXZ90_06635 [Clostridiales bacterium]|nr:hypothetical protein [Clostridiales bacterium]